MLLNPLCRRNDRSVAALGVLNRSSFDFVYAAVTSEVHPEQRVAATGIEVRQYGQSLVFGGGGGAAFRRFTDFTIRKTTNAIIRNEIMSFKNAPYAMTGNPFVFASASDNGCCPDRSINKFEKSALPNSKPIGGIMTPSTSD